MKIIYKQPKDTCISLCKFCVDNCIFKKLSLEKDSKRITKKAHHHTCFELHVITEGFQEYEVMGERYRLENGSFLLICPNAHHTVLSYKPDTQKYSITFNKEIKVNSSCLFGKCDCRILDSLNFILDESRQKKEISSTLIENSILEILVWFFRLLGIKEYKTVQSDDENMIVSLAKQYIQDNIELNPNVSDVAEYTYLSTKQLTRIFNAFEGVSPGDYITKARIARIEDLICNSSYSLKQISDIMHFNNEYYFNTFFKKHLGMPPGEYRKMLGQ